MMRKIFFILMLVLLSCLVIAESDLYYKKGEKVDIKLPCINNGSMCSGSATCNITVNYPNGTNLINNQLMTNAGAYHNYTLTSSTVLGEYYSIVYCNDSSVMGYSTFPFTINNSGNKENDNQIIAVYIVLLCLVIGYLFVAFKLDSAHIAAKITLFLSGLLNLLAILFVAYAGLVSYFSISDMVLYLFEGNSILMLGIVGLFWLSTLKRSAKMKEEKEDRI